MAQAIRAAALHRLGMSRRNFLRLFGSAAVLAPLAHACATPPRAASGAAGPSPGGSAGPGAAATSAPGAAIRAVAFDLFTIFDPRSMIAAVEAAAPGHGPALALAWRTRQFEYAWLRAAGDRYVDFRTLTADALEVAARERHVELGPAARDQLVDAYSALEPWPDAAAALGAMRQSGLRLAPLANYTPAMITALVTRAGLRDVFEHLLSTDAVRSFKPHPRAYQLGVDRFGLPREQIAFAAFGGWDAAGATWFGYPTFWVNRLGVELEQLGRPTAIGRTLTELAAWIAAHNAARADATTAP
jgi:2-haloacid dehalogenase